ncbi:hypothetical protein DFH06DRAFT_1464056 [Mycena polygramma]|nr:hypothetical protein DFH06DRAFT_1464056 [Mycena polygramma]
MAGMYDKTHIQGLIEAKRTKISTLATQIHNLTRLREAEISEMAVLQLMISPVGKLPTELLAHIFHLVVPPEEISEWDQDNFDDIIEGALTVSQVCRHWRRIAHGTPRLWVEGFRLSASQNTEIALEQTTAWLERSCPLPITIFFRDVANDDVDLAKTGVLGALLSTPGRWGRIFWNLPHLLPLCDLPPGSLLSLEQLIIEDLDFKIPLRGLDLSAPLLRRVKLCVRRNDDRHRNTLPLFRLPWTQLTHIFLGESLCLKDCCTVVLQCTNAQSITIYAVGWEGVLPATIAVLPFLETLEIYVCDSEDGPISGITHLLGRLALPALKSLDLTIEDQADDMRWDVRKFSEFQDRSPNIEKIELKFLRSAIGADHLIPLLRHSPAITELVLGDCHIDDAFIHELEVDEDEDGHQVLAPRLVKLDLRGIGDGPSDDALEAMVRSRWHPERLPASNAAPGIHFACVQEVAVSRRYARDEENSISPELRESLGPLRKQGLYLYLH